MSLVCIRFSFFCFSFCFSCFFFKIHILIGQMNVVIQRAIGIVCENGSDAGINQEWMHVHGCELLQKDVKVFGCLGKQDFGTVRNQTDKFISSVAHDNGIRRAALLQCGRYGADR